MVIVPSQIGEQIIEKSSNYLIKFHEIVARHKVSKDKFIIGGLSSGAMIS
jgi:hypothetical protein